MKNTSKGPDFLTVLAVIVGIGVIVTMKAQASWETKNTPENIAAQAYMAKQQAKLNPFFQ